MTDQRRLEDLEVAGYGYGDVDKESMDGPGLWLRVPHRGQLRLLLLRPLPLRYTAHWMRRAYIPCQGRDKCDWCTLAIGTKTRYVYSVWDVDRKRSGLIEVGPDTAAQIRDTLIKAGSLPGTAFKLSKRGGVVNGAINVDIVHQLYHSADLPEGPDPETILRKQWSAPGEDRG